MQTTIETAKQIIDFFKTLKQNGTLQKIKDEMNEFVGTTSAFFSEQFAPFMPQTEPMEETFCDSFRVAQPPQARK